MERSGYAPTAAVSQVAGNPDLFLGRTALPHGAGPVAFTLGLFRMNWATNTLHFQSTLLDVPAATPIGNLRAALDPTTVEYRGEIWVAFECSVEGLSDNSSCVAPFDLQSGRLDLSRLSAPVRGVKSSSGDEHWSASVPKLFTDNGRLFMYSSVVDHLPNDRGGFQGVSSHGIELAETSGGVMQVAGAQAGYIGSTDRRAPDVENLRMQDPTANALADISDVKQINGNILVATAVGGMGSGPDEVKCVTPISRSRGCYHLEIRQGAAPLGSGVFDREVSNANDLPQNAINYAHFIVLPNGQNAIIAHIYPPPAGEGPPEFANPGSAIGLAIITSPVLQ
jgi:hypothetical protein